MENNDDNNEVTAVAVYDQLLETKLMEPNRIENGRIVVVRRSDFLDKVSMRSITKPDYVDRGSFYFKYDRERVVNPEFDFQQVFTYYHNEPLIERAISKRVSLMFKNGWKIVGKDKTLVKQINEKFFEKCLIGGKTPTSFLIELCELLLRYSNAFIYKKRVASEETNESGVVYKVGKKIIKPTTTYQLISPLVMKPKLDKDGRIIQWLQYSVDKSREIAKYNPNDIIHLYMNRETGFIFGKPKILSIVQDVDALRRIEENVQMLVAIHLFPLYQYIVGTEERPAKSLPNGTTEVDAVQEMVESLPTQGVIFTPERHKIQAVSTDSVMDVNPYLSYFKNRLYTGLGVSSVDMGEGDTSNRGTAVTISQALKDSIGFDQTLIAEMLNATILKDIILEIPGTKNEIVPLLMNTNFRFMTIDVDEKIKKETHAQALYNSGAISHNEMRDAVNQDPWVSEQDLIDNTTTGIKFKFQVVLAELAAKLKSQMSASTGSGSEIKTSAAKSSASTERYTSNILRPENAQGKKLDPKRLTNSLDWSVFGLDMKTDEDKINTISEWLIGELDKIFLT